MRWLLVLSVAVFAGCGADATVEATDAGAEATTVELPPWRQVADPPLSARTGAVIGWTGEDIVVVGGSTWLCPRGADCSAPTEPAFRDGAAFDPVRETWRAIADAPIPVVPRAPTASLDGDVYVLAASMPGEERAGGHLLRYRATDDAWTTIEIPSPVDGLVAAGTGLVAHPTSDEAGETPDLWFDPATDTWSELDEDPLSPSFDRLYAWDGDDLHLFAKEITPSPGGASGPALVMAAVLEDGSWRELPTGGVLGIWTVIADGSRLVDPTLGCADGGAVNGYGRCIPYGAVFDTGTDTWAELAEPPSGGGQDARSSGAFTDDQVLLTGLGHPMLDLRSDTWASMPRIDDEAATVERTFAGAGPYGFASGGSSFADGAGELLADAWLWVPPAGPGG